MYSCVYSIRRYVSGTFIHTWLFDINAKHDSDVTAILRDKGVRGSFEVKTNEVM